MPAPMDQLRAMQAARLEVQIGEQWLVLPPAGDGERPPLPASLRPVTWLVAPGDPQQLEALKRAASQAGHALLDARVDGQPACGLHGVTRDRAMKLAYKRKQSLIIGLFEHRAEVVYTGLGSRR